jgi:hypothetical protein
MATFSLLPAHNEHILESNQCSGLVHEKYLPAVWHPDITWEDITSDSDSKNRKSWYCARFKSDYRGVKKGKNKPTRWLNVELSAALADR